MPSTQLDTNSLHPEGFTSDASSSEVLPSLTCEIFIFSLQPYPQTSYLGSESCMYVSYGPFFQL